MQYKVFNVLGKEVSQVELNANVFEVKPYEQAMFDVILLERALKRQGTKHTKTVSEVRGGGRKPWKQKHTGRARHGSIRSPIWKGGGIAHGPRNEKIHDFKLNKKVIKLAHKSGWSQKFQEKSLILIDKINFFSPSTKDFSKMIQNLNSNVKRLLIVLNENENNVLLSCRNLENVITSNVNNISLNDLLNANRIIVTLDNLKIIEERLAK